MKAMLYFPVPSGRMTGAGGTFGLTAPELPGSPEEPVTLAGELIAFTNEVLDFADEVLASGDEELPLAAKVLHLADRLVALTSEVLGSAEELLGSARELSGSPEELFPSARELSGSSEELFPSARELSGSSEEVQNRVNAPMIWGRWIPRKRRRRFGLERAVGRQNVTTRRGGARKANPYTEFQSLPGGFL
jgi:hypothetical protein